MRKDIEVEMANVFNFNDDGGVKITNKLRNKYKGTPNEGVFEYQLSEFMVKRAYKDISIPGIITGGKSAVLGSFIDIGTAEFYGDLSKKYGLSLKGKKLEKKIEESDAFDELIKGKKTQEELMELFNDGVIGDLFTGVTQGDKKAATMTREMFDLYNTSKSGTMSYREYLQDDGVTDSQEEGGLSSGYTGLANAEIVEENIQLFKYLNNAAKFNNESIMLTLEATKNNADSIKVINDRVRQGQ